MVRSQECIGRPNSGAVRVQAGLLFPHRSEGNCTIPPPFDKDLHRGGRVSLYAPGAEDNRQESPRTQVVGEGHPNRFPSQFNKLVHWLWEASYATSANPMRIYLHVLPLKLFPG